MMKTMLEWNWIKWQSCLYHEQYIQIYNTLVEGVCQSITVKHVVVDICSSVLASEWSFE